MTGGSPAGRAAERPAISVVCAVYNEGAIVGELADRIAAAMRPLGWPWEMVIVDDGSADATLTVLRERALVHPELRAVELVRNAGQVGALGAGLTVARGDRIVTMDGDLQHDPADIPSLLAHADAGHDLVATWRAKRAEPVRRRIVTFVGNRVNRMLTGLDVRDFGSTFRVIDGRIVDSLRDHHGNVHYNTPALYAAARRAVQIPITQHQRGAGSTKWTFAMFVSYNLDFVTASQRFVHIVLAASLLGMTAGAALYLLKLLGAAQHVEAASAPAIIVVSSMQLAMLAIVWREVIQAQRYARGVRQFVVRHVWRVQGGEVRPEEDR